MVSLDAHYSRQCAFGVFSTGFARFMSHARCALPAGFSVGNCVNSDAGEVRIHTTVGSRRLGTRGSDRETAVYRRTFAKKTNHGRRRSYTYRRDRA